MKQGYPNHSPEPPSVLCAPKSLLLVFGVMLICLSLFCFTTLLNHGPAINKTFSSMHHLKYWKQDMNLYPCLSKTISGDFQEKTKHAFELQNSILGLNLPVNELIHKILFFSFWRNHYNNDSRFIPHINEENEGSYYFGLLLGSVSSWSRLCDSGIHYEILFVYPL